LRLIPPEKRAEYLEGARIAAIGPITSRTARDAGLTVDIEAGEHTVPALVEASVEARGKAR
jgi:uroporphyrinogen III methyltransferase/synthase